MSGIFEHLAATDTSAQVAARKSAAVANKRVKDRLGAFLANAGSLTDLRGRLSLVEDELKQIVASVVAEHGGDAERLYASVVAGWEDLVRGPDGRWQVPSGSGDGDIDSELADAPSAVGSDVGEGVLAKTAGDPNGDPSNPANAEAAENRRRNQEQRDYDRVRNEKGPMFEVVPAQPEHCDVLQNCGAHFPEFPQGFYTILKDGKPHSMFDDGVAGAKHIGPANTELPEDDPRQQIIQPYRGVSANANTFRRLTNDRGTCSLCHGTGNDGYGTGWETGERCPACGGSGYGFEEDWDGVYGTPEDDPARHDDPRQARVAADAPEGAGGAVKREKLPKADESGLGGPSPKIDKSKAGDEKGNNQSPIDTEMSGSPNPTTQQKITDGRGDAEKGTSDYKHESPTEHSKNTLKTEDLPTADEWAGFADGGVDKGPNTDTWSEAETDPVTSDKGEGVLASIDPDKNPIAENLARWNEEQRVQSAIAEYEGESHV